MEEIKKLLRELVNNLENLDSRFSSIENSRREDTFLEEVHLPEERGFLGRKILSTNDSGKVQKVFRHPVCDNCGLSLNGNFIVCLNCHRKICEGCSVQYDGRTYCHYCLRELIPLNKKDVKLLLLLSNGIKSISKITRYAGISKDDILNSLNKLKAYNLISKSGLSILSKIIVNDNGLSVLYAYLQIFRKDLDVIELCDKLTFSEVDKFWLGKSLTK